MFNPSNVIIFVYIPTKKAFNQRIWQCFKNCTEDSFEFGPPQFVWLPGARRPQMCVNIRASVLSACGSQKQRCLNECVDVREDVFYLTVCVSCSAQVCLTPRSHGVPYL